MKSKIAAVVAAVALLGLGVAVAVGGSGEDPLVAKSYLEDTYPSAVAQQLEQRADQGNKATYESAAAKLDRLGEADVKAAEALDGKIGGYESKQVSAGDVLNFEQGASFVVYDGGGKLSGGALADVTAGRLLAQVDPVEAGHRYVVSAPSGATVQADAAGHFAVQGTVTVTEGGGQLPFTDIKDNDWYRDAVNFVYQRGYFSGVSTDTFSPNTSMTRAMLATVLYRVSGAKTTGAQPTFTDVPAGMWYSDAIAWASGEGIVDGMGDGTYRPDQPVTREQMVTMLYRYQTHVKGSTSAKGSLGGYPDGDKVSSWAKEAMEWAVGAKLVQGRNTGHLDPQGTATRAEVATVLQRFDALR